MEEEEMRFRNDEMFTSGIFHLTVADHGWWEGN